jgi:hypothetical protein
MTEKTSIVSRESTEEGAMTLTMLIPKPIFLRPILYFLGALKGAPNNTIRHVERYGIYV